MNGEHDASPTPCHKELAHHLPHLHRLWEQQIRWLYDRWNRRLDRHQLDDEIQSLHVAILKANRKHPYDPARPFLPWVHTIVNRRLIDRERQFSDERTRPQVQNESSFSTSEFLGCLSECPNKSGGTESTDWRIPIILQELARLPMKKQVAIRKRYFEEADYESIARELGVKDDTARGLVCRGLKDLYKLVCEAIRRNT